MNVSGLASKSEMFQFGVFVAQRRQKIGKAFARICSAGWGRMDGDDNAFWKVV